MVDRSQMGVRAAELLLGSIAQPDAVPASVIITPEWHEGDTLRKEAPHACA